MLESELTRVRKVAEAAVADMPDGDLRTKAFEVILSHLLSGSQASATSSNAPEAAPPEQTVEKSVVARIMALKKTGFFHSQRTIGDIQGGLAQNGWHYAQNNLSGKLQQLTRRRILRRVPGKEGTRTVWKYSEP